MSDVLTTVSEPAGLASPCEAAGPSRPTWSGLVHLGLLAFPVKAYPAVVSAPELPAHLVHARCGQRIRYARCCPDHGTLEAGAITKAYQAAPGQLLVLDETELEQLRPARDRALHLDGFLDPGQVDPLLFSGRSLYLTPGAIAARPPYALLVQTLAQRQQAALGRLVLSSRRQVEAYRHPLRWSDYRDDSVEALLALVQAKLQGQTPSQPPLQPTPVPALLDALRQSVAALNSAAAGSRAGQRGRRRA
jgi:non-homologous end joining protein Ku